MKSNIQNNFDERNYWRCVSCGAYLSKKGDLNIPDCKKVSGKSGYHLWCEIKYQFYEHKDVEKLLILERKKVLEEVLKNKSHESGMQLEMDYIDVRVVEEMLKEADKLLQA